MKFVAGWIGAALAVSLGGAALAAPCVTPEAAGPTAIAFPAGEGASTDELTLARSFPPVILAIAAEGLSDPSTCERYVLTMELGSFQVGGDNTDPMPRRGVGLGPLEGYNFYVVSNGAPAPTYSLVLHTPANLDRVIGFHNAVPTKAEITAELNESRSLLPLVQVDRERNSVTYGFPLGDGVAAPPPQTTVTLPDGGTRRAGPQYAIQADSPTPSTIAADAANFTIRHVASGAICPEEVQAANLKLNRLIPLDNQISCQYRQGTDLAYEADALLRYHLQVVQEAGADPVGVVESLRSNLPPGGVLRDPPWAPIAFPGGLQVATLTQTNGFTLAVWIGKKGDWLYLLNASYPSSAANDAEAGVVAQALFGLNAAPVP